MSSSPRSEPGATPAAWLPAPTPEDAAAQRAARAVSPGSDRFAVLSALDAFGTAPRRTTAAGREPFRLDAMPSSSAVPAGQSERSAR